MKWRSAIVYFVFLVAVALLPVVAWVIRGERAEGCYFDGQAIVDRFQVQIEEGEHKRLFCCIGCAVRWWKTQTKPRSVSRILVTDEKGGQLFSADRAIFVESTVITNSVMGNRIHAFLEMEAAASHRENYSGVILDRNPFSP